MQNNCTVWLCSVLLTALLLSSGVTKRHRKHRRARWNSDSSSHSDESSTRQSKKKPELPKISIYYEMLCPPSVDFMAESFASSVQEQPELLKLANIELVPFGNGYTIQFLDQVVAICQHEEAECLGNKYNICALQSLDPNEGLQFTACLAKETHQFLKKDVPLAMVDFTKLVLPCLQVIDKPIADTIDRCAIDEKNDRLFVKYERATNSSGIKFTPWITVNGIYNPRIDAEIRNSLLGYLCKTTSKSLRAAYCPDKYKSARADTLSETVEKIGDTLRRPHAILDSGYLTGCPSGSEDCHHVSSHDSQPQD